MSQDFFPVPDQHFPGAPLQSGIPQKRYQGRDENKISRTHLPGRAHGFIGDFGIVVGQKRNQQMSEIGHIAQCDSTLGTAPVQPISAGVVHQFPDHHLRGRDILLARTVRQDDAAATRGLLL